jgi:hypothetical protein
MARPESPLARDGSPTREFAFWLRDLRSTKGLTYEQLKRRTGYATSTLQEALNGRRLPTLTVTVAFVRACGGDAKEWHAYWNQVRRALDQDAPAALGRPLTPPWLAPATAGSGSHGEQCPPDCARTDPHGWYTESVAALLRLDTGAPEAVERRVVVATSDGLTEIPTSFSVPRHSGDAAPSHDLDVTVLDGGRLDLREQPYESYFRQKLLLPAPLKAGDRHAYAIRLRIPPDQPMAPHYVHVPLTRSERFTLQVRFDPARPPEAVWRLSEVPTAVIYERAPGTTTLAPDAEGVVTAEFAGMRVGYGYGLSWQPPR